MDFVEDDYRDFETGNYQITEPESIISFEQWDDTTGLEDTEFDSHANTNATAEGGTTTKEQRTYSPRILLQILP
jgi:hypothetical protein